VRAAARPLLTRRLPSTHRFLVVSETSSYSTPFSLPLQGDLERVLARPSRRLYFLELRLRERYVLVRPQSGGADNHSGPF
jgi:hypothetical protein